MKDSLLKRARCRLGKDMKVPGSCETHISEKGLTRYDQQAPDLANTTTVTIIKATNRLQKILMVISKKYRERLHDELTQRLHQDVRNARSIDILHTMDFLTPVSKYTQGQSLSFLSMPAEIRNEVYQYLLPDVTSLRDVTGLLCACKQIRQELSSMIVAESQIVMNIAVQKSIDLVQVAYSTTEVNAVIGAPKIQTHSHLRNVNVSLGLRDTDSQTADADVPTIYFDEVFSSFRELLSLHLPYVTINVPATIANDASIADPELRRRLLDSCILTFRRLEETPGVTLNVQHVVFEIRNQKWDTAALVYNPIVVFYPYNKYETRLGSFDMWIKECFSPLFNQA
ncbi:hypothetical protein J4E91_001472 [Alternaria rosae]|nr:hypothetical protein J4E91_001472 [Alternaria rosae]